MFVLPIVLLFFILSSLYVVVYRSSGKSGGAELSHLCICITPQPAVKPRKSKSIGSVWLFVVPRVIFILVVVLWGFELGCVLWLPGGIGWIVLPGVLARFYLPGVLEEL